MPRRPKMRWERNRIRDKTKKNDTANKIYNKIYHSGFDKGEILKWIEKNWKVYKDPPSLPRC